MMMAMGVVVVVVVVTWLFYVADNYGEYKGLKPDFPDYIVMKILGGLDVIKEVLSKIVIWTPNGKIFHPENRPKGYFQEGDKVYFFNYVKVYPYYEDPMGLIIPGQPEGRLDGQVLQENDGVVKVVFGDSEYSIYYTSKALMHHWEFSSLKRNPLIRFFYFLDTDEGSKNLRKALVSAPLH